jgi:hypothetical protein
MMRKTKMNDYLQWIGGSYYSIESFLQEAEKIGVMRRIPYIPTFIPMESKIFLAHDVTERISDAVEIIEHKKSVAELKKYRTFRVRKRIHPVIFAYFIPVGVVFFPQDKFYFQEVLEEKYRLSAGQTIPFYILKGIKTRIPLAVVQYTEAREMIQENFKRGCGLPKQGGIYLASFTAFYRALAVEKRISFEEAREMMMKELNLAQPLPDIVELNKWVKIRFSRIRALKKLSENTAKKIFLLSNT